MPETAQAASGMEAARSSTRLLYGTGEPVLRCKGRSHKRLKPRGRENPDAEHRGGVARSRDEGSVMGLDRRGCVVDRGHGPTEANWQQEEPVDEVKPAVRLPTVEHGEPYESRGSRTVLGAPEGEIPWATRPNVWSGRALQEVFVEMLERSCINVSGLLIGVCVLRAIMDISARAISLAVRPRLGHSGHQCSHAPGRPILHLVSSSRRPRRVSVSIWLRHRGLLIFAVPVIVGLE